MLTAALRCNKVPDAVCLEKIAAQVKVDRFIWGVMQKAPGNQVKAEVHLYEKGKPDSVVRETYAENLRDQNDDTLRGIAKKMFERLVGASAGTLTVKAGSTGGTVVIDGQKRGSLKGGELTMELPVGGHRVDVHVAGYLPATEDVNVMLGKDTRVTVNLVREESPPERPETSFPTRKVIGGALITVGAILAGVAIYEATQYFKAKSDLKGATQDNYGEPPYAPPGQTAQAAPQVKDPCHPDQLSFSDGTRLPQTDATSKGCDALNRGHTATALGFTLGALGAVSIGTGFFFLLSPGASKEAEPKGEAQRVRLAPYAGPHGGGLALSAVF
jgi:hypothetical protein